jgi:predicted amidohydrolase
MLVSNLLTEVRMIVAGLQLDIEWEEPEENFRRAAELTERAVAQGARMVALPEMFATGYSVRTLAATVHADATREFLSELARRHRLWVLGGYAEPGDPRPANACSLMAPDGSEALHYRKVHPFSLAREQELFAGGDRIETADVEGVRVTPVICYDLRFPELFRAAADATDLYVVIANWPNRRGPAWRVLMAARAIDGQAWLLGVNRVGEAGGLMHDGDSALVDPMGEVVTTLSKEPGVVVGEVDPDRVREIRERFGFLADRRPEIYPKLGHNNR